MCTFMGLTIYLMQVVEHAQDFSKVKIYSPIHSLTGHRSTVEDGSAQDLH